jgi:hypothetical protein
VTCRPEAGRHELHPPAARRTRRTPLSASARQPSTPQHLRCPRPAPGARHQARQAAAGARRSGRPPIGTAASARSSTVSSQPPSPAPADAQPARSPAGPGQAGTTGPTGPPRPAHNQ